MVFHYAAQSKYGEYWQVSRGRYFNAVVENYKGMMMRFVQSKFKMLKRVARLFDEPSVDRSNGISNKQADVGYFAFTDHNNKTTFTILTGFVISGF